VARCAACLSRGNNSWDQDSSAKAQRHRLQDLEGSMIEVILCAIFGAICFGIFLIGLIIRQLNAVIEKLHNMDEDRDE
jgi:hypothetical protein